MKIAIDGQTTLIKKSGFGSYVENLAKHLVKIDPEIVIDFIHPNTNKDFSTPKRILWDQLIFPLKARRLRPDIIHKPSFSAPYYSGIKTILTVHDLIPMLYPKNFSKTSAFYYNKIMAGSIRRADKIITISEHSKNDLTRLLKINPKKITVIPLAAAEEYKIIKDRAAINNIKKRHGITKDYILTVGTLEPRKNLDFLIKVYANIIKQNPTFSHQLAITGKKGWRYEQLFNLVKKYSLEDNIVFTDYVKEEDLPYLYNGATLFVFPSIYEGFGLPPLEAMACGLPVVCSNSSSLPEVCGDAAKLLSPNDLDGWTKSIQEITGSANLINQYRTKSLERSKEFSWDKAAEETLKVYKSLMSEKI